MRHLVHFYVIRSDVPIRYPRHFSVEVKANGGRSAGKRTVAGDTNLDRFPPQDRDAWFLCIDRFRFSPEGKRSEAACSRQGVTGSWVQFIYITLSSLTLRRLMSYIYIYIYIYIYMEHPFLMFLDHTQRRSTVGRTPLAE